MGAPNYLKTRDLAGQPDHDGQADRLHYGAAQVAARVFGVATDATIRIIYRWQNELDPAQRPDFLIKIGRHVAAWESQIRRHAELTTEI